MNNKLFAKTLLLGASLFLASTAFAGEKSTVKVYENVKVNGKTLTPGTYNLAWEGSGNSVQLSIQKGKETVTTVPAQIETSQTSAASTGYSTKQDTDGKTLTNVFFAGKKYSLNLDQQAAASSAAASTSGNK
jgi:hypothetical protein